MFSAARLFTMAVVLSFLAAGGALTPGGAVAQSRIGNTAVAKNTVEQVAASKSTPVQLGDDVFADERVRTGQDSAAKFVFSDSTNLALGPVSTVVLDKFVYKGDTSYAKAAVNFTAGAFRFTTGGSDKGAYQLKTSTATIGVRGTQFDLTVKNGVTTVTLLEGEVAVCPTARYSGDPRKLSQAQLKQYGCIDMKPGQTAQVTKSRARFGGAPSNFASACGGAAGLCSTTVAAGATPATSAALDPSDPALCYVNTD